jgi:hypothetical protein
MTEKDTAYTKHNKKYYQKNKQRYREYYKLHKQQHIEYVTKYREEHRNKLNERIYCECGGYYRYCDRSRHKNKLKHIMHQNKHITYQNIDPYLPSMRKISKTELLQDKHYLLLKCDPVVKLIKEILKDAGIKCLNETST